MIELILVLHNLRSSHNVGSLLRSAECLGVQKVFMTGYTPYPAIESDSRLPHLAAKNTKDIAKTALGAEKIIDWEHQEDVLVVLQNLKTLGYTIACLEQSADSINMQTYVPTQKIVVVVGNEINGVDEVVLRGSDVILEIPMRGKKESLNVAVAGSIAVFYLLFSITK